MSIGMIYLTTCCITESHSISYHIISSHPTSSLFHRLERRFLERVAQTNRVKSSGVGATAGPGGPNNPNVPMTVGGGASSMGGSHDFQRMNQNNMGSASRQGNHEPPSPPWLQPPLGFKHGNGAVLAASNLSGSSSRAAAAGRALLGGSLFQRNNNDKQQQPNNDSRDFLAELQRRASQQSMLQSLQQQNQSSASNFLAAAVRSGNNGGLSAGGGSGLSMAQLAQSASGKPNLLLHCICSCGNWPSDPKSTHSCSSFN